MNSSYQRKSIWNNSSKNFSIIPLIKPLGIKYKKITRSRHHVEPFFLFFFAAMLDQSLNKKKMNTIFTVKYFYTHMHIRKQTNTTVETVSVLGRSLCNKKAPLTLLFCRCVMYLLSARAFACRLWYPSARAGTRSDLCSPFLWHTLIAFSDI